MYSIPQIDEIIKEHATLMFKDDQDQLGRYKNHCYRVYNMVIHGFSSSSTPLTKDEKKLVAIAMGFHDLALFTEGGTADYLPPSEDMAEKWLRARDMDHAVDFVRALIEYHHKLSPYVYQSKDGFLSKREMDIVERMRQSDWTDVFAGWYTFDMDPGDVKALRDPFPERGFHFDLLRKELTWIVKHPLNPMPWARW